MKNGILIAILTLLMSAGAQAASWTASHADTYQTVVASVAVSHPCVSVRGSGAWILLSEDNLIELSRHSGQSYHTENERLTLIAGDRAAILLEAKSSDLDASGCFVTSLDHEPNTRRFDVMYLVGQLIESGQAVILRDGSLQPESRIVIHDHNDLLSGWRSYEYIGGGKFLSITTWIS